MKIDWSGRPHEFTNKDVKYLTNIIKKADPLTQGKYLKKFESDFSKYIKKKNTFAVSSAASALEIIAALLHIKKDDEIILPAHTYCASAIPFARNKAKLIWADIDFKSRTIDLLSVSTNFSNSSLKPSTVKPEKSDGITKTLCSTSLSGLVMAFTY